jgi:hypothetical protein
MESKEGELSFLVVIVVSFLSKLYSLAITVAIAIVDIYGVYLEKEETVFLLQLREMRVNKEERGKKGKYIILINFPILIKFPHMTS